MKKKEWDYLKQRFTDHWPRMSGLTWSLIHTYESKPELGALLTKSEPESFIAQG